MHFNILIHLTFTEYLPGFNHMSFSFFKSTDASYHLPRPCCSQCRPWTSSSIG